MFDCLCLTAEFRKCAQTGWSRAGRVSTAELLDHCQWRLQPRRLCAVRLATVIHSTPSTGREARELPRIRFRYTVTPAKREWFFRHHCHRYFAHGLHGILQIPKTQVGQLMLHCRRLDTIVDDRSMTIIHSFTTPKTAKTETKKFPRILILYLTNINLILLTYIFTPKHYYW